MPIKASQLKRFVQSGVTFVETGTNFGDGISAALEAGFESIISIEIDGPLFWNARRKFEQNKNVKIYLGDSADTLKRIEGPISKAVFWMDAHKDKECAALRELGAIKHRRGDVVLIDDFRYFRSGHWRGMEEVLKTFKSFEYYDGAEKDDILVGVL